MKALKDELQRIFSRMTKRDQMVAVVGVAGVFLVLMLGVGWAFSSAVARGEHRVEVKRRQLVEVLKLQGAYKEREKQRREDLRKLTRSKIRLVSLVEKVARQAGVEIGQLRPEKREPNADGLVEERVDLRAAGLSVDRLQDFLTRLEGAPGVVVVDRLRVKKPYRKEELDLELTVLTYSKGDAR